MKILNQRLTPKEASQLCARMKIVTAIKLRLGEILGIENDPKDDPLVCRLTHNLNDGQVITIDTKECKVVGLPPEYYHHIELPPAKLPEPPVYYHIKSKDLKKGPIDWKTFERLIPTCALEDITVWHDGMSEWLPLEEIRDIIIRD